MARPIGVWGLLIFFAGLAYGYFTPGKTDKSALYTRAVLWGVGIAVVLALLGFFFGVDALGVVGGGGILGLVLDILILGLVFIVGVWIGDLVEGRRETHGGARRV